MLEALLEALHEALLEALHEALQEALHEALHEETRSAIEDAADIHSEPSRPLYGTTSPSSSFRRLIR